MCKHEEKYCPNCNAVFECKVGDILHCQCYGIRFTEEEKKFIASKFSDCLCAACMISLKATYNNTQHALQLKVFSNGR